MPKYTVLVTQTKTYEIPINAIDESDAITLLSEWVEEDFTEYNTDNAWIMEAK